MRSGAGKAPTPFAHTVYAVVSVAVSALTVAALRLLHVTTEVGTAVVEKLGESMICVLFGLEQAALAASSALEAWFDAVGRVAPYAVGAAVALALHWAYSLGSGAVPKLVGQCSCSKKVEGKWAMWGETFVLPEGTTWEQAFSGLGARSRAWRVPPQLRR